MHTVISECRICTNRSLQGYLDLGNAPIADHLLAEPIAHQDHLTAPIKVLFCPECTVSQIDVTVDPNFLYQNHYPYYTSISPELVAHFRYSAESIISTRNLSEDSLIVEAASNDGCMLENFKRKGMKTVGIDPANGPAASAQSRGIHTIVDFFDAGQAHQIVSDHGRADVFLANNVLAHVPDPNDFVTAIETILKKNGIAVIEVPYCRDLIENIEFDTIYHQHLCYFTVTALHNLFERSGLCLYHIEQLNIHGGSLRCFVSREFRDSSSVQRLIETERAIGMHRFSYYRNFAHDIHHLRKKLNGLLSEIKKENKRVVGYGAAAKGTALMHFCRIDTGIVDFIVDLNPNKLGMYMPGNNIPIQPVQSLVNDPPDFVLILAWNFSREIMGQLEWLKASGCKFIVPVPNPRIL